MAESLRPSLVSLAGSVALALILGAEPGLARQGPGHVLNDEKISDTEGSFAGTLADDTRFGRALAFLGDLDGDGVGDLAVGPHKTPAAGNKGAVWILLLNPDGTVKADQEIKEGVGGFTGSLASPDHFGFAVAAPGDIDGDGVFDLAVGTASDDDGGFNRGAVWILFLKSDGTVKSHQKISDLAGGFTGVLSDGDAFGRSVGSLGDLDDNGVPDLIAGARWDNDGGSDQGAVWLLMLGSDGTVGSHQKISETSGGFQGDLDPNDVFGVSVAPLGDLDEDGVLDIAVGAQFDDDGGVDRGAVWILFLNPGGTVRSHQKISSTDGEFGGALEDGDNFGSSLSDVADVNADGVTDLAVGAWADDDGGAFHGAVWLLFLQTDGRVKAHQKISDTQGSFGGALNDDRFGCAVTGLGDLDGDAKSDIAVGAYQDDDGGWNRGAVWMLFLDGGLSPEVQAYGCGVNPSGSLVVLTGQPSIGTTFELGIDNPFGTQGLPSFPYLALSTLPDPAFPCGTALTGFGMGGPGATGELLISLLLPDPFAVLPGAFWSGAGNLVSIPLAIPASSAFVGASVFAQGLMWDPSPFAAVPFGLTEALELTIGT